jgi:CBS domain-containing protein
MRASDIMQPYAITTEPDVPASQAAIQMTVGRISGLPVTNVERGLVGIITEFDLIKALRSGLDMDTATVDDVMTHSVIAVDVATPIDDVMEVLERERIIRVPVIGDGELVGIVSREDVLKAVLGSRLNLFNRRLTWKGVAAT